jgi:YtkA-like
MARLRACCAFALVVGSCSGAPAASGEAPDVARAGEGGLADDVAGIGPGGTATGGASPGDAAGGASPGDAGGESSESQGGSAHAGAGPCENETRAEPYAAGVTAEDADGTRVTLTESVPAPRVGNHTWTLTVTDATGEPVVGATLRVTPFMPEHRHGSPLVAVVEDEGEGVYRASRVQFTMTGYWRTTVRVSTDSGVHSAVFPLCIE